MKTLISKPLSIVRATLKDKRGGIAMLLAFAILPICGAVGLALDGARGYLVKARLSTALDSAGLAAAQNLQSASLSSDINRYFTANFPTNYLDATVTGPTHSISEDSTQITLQATASIDTTFMRLLGFKTLDVSADATVATGVTGVDLVFAFDLSGSMGNWTGDGTRLDAAREAATQLVDHIYGDFETKESVNVGLVPWNAIVNVTDTSVAYDSAATTTEAVTTFTNPVNGESQSELFYANNSPVPLLFTPPDDWDGCVFARYADDGSSTNDGDVEYGPDTFGDKDWVGWQPTGADIGDEGGSGGSKKKKKKKKKKGPSGGTTSQCLPDGITPLQNSKTVIKDAIDELTWATGNTVIPQGLAWAWRVLMPDEPFTEADEDLDPFRAIILLTDGSNCGADDDAYQGVFGDCDSSQDDLDDRLTTLATNIKADGVTIIAIQFANSGTSLQTLMQEIASGDSAPYYFYAPDADALLDVFDSIGAHISYVHLVK